MSPSVPFRIRQLAPEDVAFRSDTGVFFSIPLTVPTVLGLYIMMGLRSGCVWLFFPTLRMLSRKENPAGYWAIIAAAAVVLTIFVGMVAYAAIRSLSD
jgi:hypothetical protein